MDVVGPSESARAPQGRQRPKTLGHDGGNRVAGHPEPEHRGQLEPCEDSRDGQERQRADDDSSEPYPRRRTLGMVDYARRRVREAEERRGEHENRDLTRRRAIDDQLVDDGERKPEGQRSPEVSLVERDRLRDDLSHGPRCRRQRRWQLSGSSARHGGTR